MSQSQTQVTISSGQSLSPTVALGSKLLVGIAMPAGWDAAAMTFQVSIDGTNFIELASSAAVASYTVAANQYIGVDPAIWRGVVFVKLRSGTSGAPVNQTADRVITLITS